MPRIREEVTRLQQFGISHVILIDDNSCVNIRWLGEVSDLFVDRGFTWESALRAPSVTERNLDRLRSCKRIYVGAESGSQRILDQLDKRIRVEDIFRAAELLQARGLQTWFSWMIGFPGETRDEVLMTVDALKRVASIAPGTIQRIRIYNPYPGSELFQQAVAAGFEPPQTLEQWGDCHRESTNLPYLSNPWWYKSIVYASAFHHYTSEWLGAKRFFRPILTSYKVLAGVRWRNNFFHLPVEYWPVDVGRTILRRAVPLAARVPTLFPREP